MGLTLKSAESDEINAIENARDWFNSNANLNSFPILNNADNLEWGKALVHEFNDSVVVEIPVKVKTKFAVKIKDREKLNVDQRLLVINKDGVNYSLLEFIVSEDNKENLQNINKINYSYQVADFKGTIILADISGSIFVNQINESCNCDEPKLKSAIPEEHCVVLVDNETGEIVHWLYCYWVIVDDGGGSNESGSSTSTSPTPEVIIDPSFENDPKLKCIFNKLVKTATNEYNALVHSFLLNFSEEEPDPTTISFNAKNLGINTVYGNVEGDGFNFIVNINSNYINNRAPTELAKTLIHEILHAMISRKTINSPYEFKKQFKDYIYKEKGKYYNDDHALMRDHYVDPMINFLKDFDRVCNKKIAPYEIYEGLAISGVIDMQDLTNEEITKIQNSQTFFKTRGLECE